MTGQLVFSVPAARFVRKEVIMLPPQKAVTLKIFSRAINRPAIAACSTNRTGAAKINIKSMGSVMPAMQEVITSGIRVARTRFLFSGRAVWMKAATMPM